MTPEDEAKRIQERDRARLAKQILDNPVWIEAWDQVTTNLLANMEDSRLGETETYEAKRQLLAVRVIRKQFENVVTTGRMAEVQLAENAERKRGKSKR